MGGVVIGSTMECVAAGQRWGALMINTGCNLKCPICYLGEKPKNETMKTEIAERLVEIARGDQWDGIAIIGTESLLNDDSVGIANFFARQIRTHLMTNGIHLSKFAGEILQIKRIDVSLDGGPNSYSRTDRSRFMSIAEGGRKWIELGGGELRALNTLYRENIHCIGDMLEGGRVVGAGEIFFSPYVKTLGGDTGVTSMPIAEIVNALLPFVGENWRLIVDPYHAIFEWREWKMIKEDVSRLPGKNLLIIDFDPGERVRRIGIDGSERHPFLALHPGIELKGKKII